MSTALVERVSARAAELAVRTPPVRPVEQRRALGSWLDYAQMLETFTVGGNTYAAVLGSGSRTEERIQENFRGLVEGAYKRHGPVFSCALVRMMAFSEARFAFRRVEEGRFGQLFGLRTEPLRLLERPWRNATTGDLLSRMILDADFGGNAFIARRPNRLRRMRPDYVSIICGSYDDADTVAQQVLSGDDLDADVIGYAYAPDDGVTDAEFLLADDVAHFAPIPDPVANWRGMSWLTPVIREVMGDQAASTHKLQFFRRGAQLQVVVALDKDIPVEAFDAFVARFRAQHEGVDNAYRTLFIGGGGNVTTTTATMQQVEMKALQGLSETRIAAAARVHPVVAGFSEGLQGSSLNAGNWRAAMRQLSDLTMRPLWRNAAGSLATIVDEPPDAELWYDERDVAFLREDAKDIAEIRQAEAAVLRSLGDGGWEPDAIVDYIGTGDVRSLRGHHTGKLSVQLQPADGGGDGANPSAATGA